MEVYVARQPIVDVVGNIMGYEILYRNGMQNRFAGINGDEATSNVIVNAFQNFGIDKLTDQLPAFINFTEKLIYEEIGTLFSKDILVIEILETVRPTPELLNRCRELKNKGYKIALDDFLFEEEYLGFLEVADIIKVDFLNSNQYVREEAIKKFKHYNIDFLAEKIETEEEFKLAKELGYKYFQGYLFGKPQVLTT
ncbi:EAL and HDOD domain-containing protein [Turicibacter sanguinis]|uniref:EAL and HDOD domain-containing protein n=1 Tax=Turicibacter sanguinis TaxID=154288 RepID=UPI0018A90AEF|nr:EAL domain-containing protein [Turicibacter sanguinis]MDB8558234.1 EAL domain-containing protein [Turicibacter sanguinis]MDB8561009.1 EAL domain-containing protein [Turicibacter sanguinis]